MSVELVAKYLVDVGNIEGSSRIYNCCSGVGVAIKEFVQRIIENNQSDIKMNLGYYPYTDYEAMSFWGEPTKL
jgi:dTDP-6-deoxy-L-talose 4-dehydrogenase (NAD+)